MTFNEWYDELVEDDTSRGDWYEDDLCYGCRAKDVRQALEDAFEAGKRAGLDANTG